MRAPGEASPTARARSIGGGEDVVIVNANGHFVTVMKGAPPILDISTRPDFFELRACGKNEDGRFLRFLQVVEREAAKRGRIFFVDAAEGHDFIDGHIGCCDLSGWLIRPEDIEAFERPWRDDAEEFLDMFADEMCMARWSGDPHRPGTISIEFEAL